MPQYDPDAILPDRECSKCKKSYPRTSEFFGYDKRHADGLESYCRNCHNMRTAFYQKNNPAKSREIARRYYANNRDRCIAKAKMYREKFPDRIRASRQRYRGNPENRAAELKYYQNYRMINREKIRKYQRRNRARHAALQLRREALKRALPHDLTEAQYADTLAYYNNACAYCGIPQSDLGYRLHREHIVPESCGGGYTKNNIVPSCKPCNIHKFRRTPEEAGMKLLKPWPPISP